MVTTVWYVLGFLEIDSFDLRALNKELCTRHLILKQKCIQALDESS